MPSVRSQEVAGGRIPGDQIAVDTANKSVASIARDRDGGGSTVFPMGSSKVS